jgi:hypothetical protein
MEDHRSMSQTAMPESTPLSPAAQAVLDAYMNNCGWLDGPLERDYLCTAAVLRAAAEQAENVYPVRPSTEWGEGWLEGVQDVVASFRRIAAELERAQ